MKNVVLIGYGYWGPNIAKNLKASKDLNLYGICDLDPKKIEKAKSLYGESIKYYTDYKEVLLDENIAACAVALRDQIGQIVARAVLESKKHLFMEKPMATTIEDALLLKKLADENKCIIHVDHILVFNPVIKKIKKMIDAGELGELIYFDSARANLGPHLKNDMNAMWDLAVHDLAVLDYFCDGQTTETVQCLGVHKFGKHEELTYLTVKYPGFVAMLKSSWISPLKERRMIIAGTKKMVVFDDLSESEKLLIYDKGVDLNEKLFQEYGAYEAKVRTGDLYVPYVENEDALLNSLTHFSESIDSHTPSCSGPEQAIRVLKILKEADQCLAGK